MAQICIIMNVASGSRIYTYINQLLFPQRLYSEKVLCSPIIIIDIRFLLLYLFSLAFSRDILSRTIFKGPPSPQTISCFPSFFQARGQTPQYCRRARQSATKFILRQHNRRIVAAKKLETTFLRSNPILGLSTCFRCLFSSQTSKQN